MIDGNKAAVLLEQLVARTLTALDKVDDDATPMHEGMVLAYRDTLDTLIDQGKALGIDPAALGLGSYK